MTSNRLKLFFVILVSSFLFFQCAEDDNNIAIEQESCNDGILNGDEVEVDCGGSECPPCDEGGLNFDGIFAQEDILGRPGVNTLFSGSNTFKNEFNDSLVSKRVKFQAVFEATLEDYHDIYAIALGLEVEDLNYETNILNWNAETFTRIMAQFDALQVAPNGSTTYYDSTSGLVFTGRSLSDDVIDTSLILLFGGEDGTRFDGNNDTPQLTTDAVDSGDRDFTLGFPYLEAPFLDE